MKKNLLFFALLLVVGLITTNAQYVVFDDAILNPNATLDNANAGSVNSITTDEKYTGTSSIQMKFEGAPPAPAFWCMLLINTPAETAVDLSEYASGYLNFAMKTTTTGSFNIRITDGTNKPKIMFIDGADPYGFVRDGQWHTVSIPIQDMITLTPALNMAAIRDLFVWRSGSTSDADWPAATPADVYFDDISISKTPWAAPPAGNYLFGFENDADTANWTPFANGPAGAPTDILVVPNPQTSGINKTAKSLQFTVNPNADPWVGMYNDVDVVGDKALVFTEENHIMKMMVYKTIISPVLLKVEEDPDAGTPATLEVKVSNTLVDEWEELSFDFTDAIGRTFEKFVVFPDFPTARTEGTVVLLDNIAWDNGAVSVPASQTRSLSIYPNPARSRITVNGISSLHAKVISITGQVVKSIDQKSAQLDVSDLQKGVYFLSGKSEGKPYVLKFIKN